MVPVPPVAASGYPSAPALKQIPSEAYGARTEPLFVPPQEEVRSVLAAALAKNYAESSVEIVECPDLKQWKLCQSGLSNAGRNVLVDVGGEPFNHDERYNSKVKFEIGKVAAAAGFSKCAVLCAGACCSEVINGHWGELTGTLHLEEGSNASYAARVSPDGAAIQEPYASTLHGGLCNLHLSDGVRGQVFKVVAKKRIGEEISFVQTMRKGLLEAFPNKATGLGGTFRLVAGKVKAHIQPDRSACPDGYYDKHQMKCTKDFLQFYKGDTAVGPDLTMISSMWSQDPTGGALHLRGSGEHTHFFSPSGTVSGHYHGDESPDEVEYEGYFVSAGEIARVRDAVSEEWMNRSSKPSVAVLGAGAMGCLIGGLLHEGGLDVTLVDKWQAHVDVINKDGLKLVGVGGERVLKIKATTDVASLGKFDVVIVQCKSGDTKAALTAALHLFHDETVAVSFQNGLGNEDIMAEVLGDASRVFGGQTLQGANVNAPGEVRIHTDLASYMGEWNGGVSERCGRLCRIFTEAGLPTLEDADIKKKVWMKVIYNCVVSPLSALTSLAHKDVYARNDSIYVAEKIIAEALQVARAEGLKITEEEARECLDKVIASNQANKSSMAMDIEAKRVSEMDFINGRVALIAEKHGIDVPFNRSMVFFVKALESHFAEGN